MKRNDAKFYDFRAKITSTTDYQSRVYRGHYVGTYYSVKDKLKIIEPSSLNRHGPSKNLYCK